MIKYKTRMYRGADIQAIEVSRETDSSVWIESTIRSTKGDRKEERRIAKVSTYDHYHDTWELAKQHLLNNAEGNLRSARRALELAQAMVGNVKGMKPPKEEQ